jgi:hypothetical protein
MLTVHIQKGRSLKQNKSKDLEGSDLLTEDVKVDGIPRNVYYTGKAIRRLPLSEAKLSVPWPILVAS